MPDSDADSEPDAAWGGECMPACYKSGYQDPATTTAYDSATADECWPANDIDYATYSGGTGDDWLRLLSGTEMIQGCELDATSGFCTCHEDWVSNEDGTCKPPCYVALQDIGSASVFDECWHTTATVVTDDAGLQAEVSGCIIKDDTTDTYDDYYCMCDTLNGWAIDDTTGPTTGKCIRVCLRTGQDDDGVVTGFDECWVGTGGVAATFLDYTDDVDFYPTVQNAVLPYDNAVDPATFEGCKFVSDTATDAFAGFCACDEANGHYQYFPNYDLTGTPEISDNDSPCAYAAFIPGQQ
jgi:hypothetical protein